MTEETAVAVKEEPLEDPTRADEWIDIHDEIKGRQDTVGSDAFLKKLRDDTKNGRAEMRDWIYGFMLKLAKVGALTAEDVVDLEDEIGDLREELDRLGNLTRAIASTNFFALVQRLVMLVKERVQDQETLHTAQIVEALFSPAQPQTNPVVAP
jgi:hypothetical protein